MKNPLLRKILMVSLLTLLLCIPLGMIRSTVGERSFTREQVRQEFTQSTAGEQWVAGPILVQPYRQRHIGKTKDDNGFDVINHYWTDELRYWLPQQLTVEGALENQARYRGIYKVQLYQSLLEMKALFSFDEQPPLTGTEEVVPGTPYIAIGIADVRGLNTTPRIVAGGSVLDVAADARFAAFPGGIHAPLPVLGNSALEVSVAMELKGMDSLHLLPVGRDTSIALGSQWPHPSFTGRFLPEAPEISAAGFSARWRTNFLASNMKKHVQDCLQESCDAFRQATMGVRLIEPVDIYLKSERALKYGFLFVLITFIVFFLFEVMRTLRIHPFQYLLVGAALTIFFLLLLSLSEHAGFGVAYVTAATGCVSLLWFYVSHVLGSLLRGSGFAAMLAVLFAGLYGLLQSEDYALLLGAGLLFVLLAVVMVATRKINWFAIGELPSREKVPGNLP